MARGGGELDLVLVDGAMLTESLIQFSVDGHGCVPSLFFDLRPVYVLDPAAGHHRPKPLPETPGHSWTSLGQECAHLIL